MQSIVIVDDETIPRKIAEKALKDKYLVSSYADARTALSELSITRPSILLIDLHMPDMDGYTFLKEIRELEDHALHSIPVVIMTSDDDAKNEIKGFDLGAYDYIRKPLLPDVLIRRVDRIMKSEEVLKHLEKQAEVDVLTGLYNRNASVQQINENLQMRRESGLFLMLDLDHFKLINDHFGHDMGDRVLSLVAEVLKKFIRSDDVLGRIGGDEFVIFYRGAWKEDALSERCEEIGKKVKEEVSRLLPVTETQFGVSIGVSMAPNHGLDFLSLYQKADEAMYHVKTAGKGGFFVYKEEETEEKEEAGILSFPSFQKRLDGLDFFPGAYFVNYSDFCSIYHFIRRSAERGHVPVQMVLFTMEESETVERRELEDHVQDFGNLLGRTIRRGDVVVRCGNKQFIILLVGTEKDNSLIAINRVLQKRTEEDRRDYPIYYEINSLIS